MNIPKNRQQTSGTKGINVLFVPLWCIILLWGCCPNDSSSLPPSHTVIFYLGGNNNLSSSILSQLNELQEGYSSASVNVLVYAALPTGAKLLRLRVKDEPQLVAQYASGRSASAEMLAEVIATCRRTARAETYSLVVASHGSGWLPAGTLQNPQRSLQGRSIITDEAASPNEMELSDFVRALPDGLFDVIVLEACLMGGVEVAYALRDKADYLLVVPAELLDPGFTPIYRKALSILCAADTDAQSRLIRFGEHYMRYINSQSGNHRSATLSVIDLAQMEVLAQAFASYVGEFPLATQEQLAPIQHVDRPGQYGDKPARARFFDLEDAALRLAKSEEGRERLTDALGRVVRWKAATATFLPSLGGGVIERYSGLTTYVPQKEFPALNHAYQATDWWQRTTRDIPVRDSITMNETPKTKGLHPKR